MDLVINQMMKLQIMHVADGNGGIKILARTSVSQADLSVAAYPYALPHLSVIPVIRKVLKDLGKEKILILLLKILPLGIYIVISKLQHVFDINLVGAVEYGNRDIEAESHCRQGQMDLKNLSDVHS